MTASELLARVRHNVGDPNGRVWADDRLVDLLNESISDLSVLIERVDPTYMSETESLSKAGADADAEILLPIHFRRLINLIRTDVTPDRQVKIVPMNQIFLYRGVDIGEVAYVRTAEYLSVSGLTGSPKYGGDHALGFLGLATGTTYTYTLYYAKRPPVLDMFRLSHTPQVPEEYHPLLAVRTTVKALAQENKPVEAFERMWTEGVQMIIQAVPRRDGQRVGVG